MCFTWFLYPNFPKFDSPLAHVLVAKRYHIDSKHYRLDDHVAELFALFNLQHVLLAANSMHWAGYMDIIKLLGSRKVRHGINYNSLILTGVILPCYFPSKPDGLISLVLTTDHNRRPWQHSSAVTWALRRLKSPTTRPHYWPYVRGIHRWPVDSPHNGPVVRKAFPCHGAIPITIGMLLPCCVPTA